MMDLQDNLRANLSVYRVSDEGETAIGIYLLILGWLSWLGNGVVILLLTKRLHTLQAQDFLTLNLALSDAGIAMFGYSRGILEVFNVFRDDGYLFQTFWTCQVDGFLILLFGLISINTLTAISVVRYIKGCQPHHAHHINRFNIFIAIGVIWLSSLFWSGAPLFGWGSYKARRYGTCEIDWAQARFSVAYRLYVILIFLFNFFLPISVIVFTYVSIMRMVSASHRNCQGKVSERQKKIERGITQVSLLLCAAFLLAWSPYAVISMWSALGYQVPPLTGLLASLFAKSASFYNPFIYMGLSAKFRTDLAELFHCLRRPLDRLGHGSPVPQEDGREGRGGGGGGGHRPLGLAPDKVQVNLDRFKESVPGDETLLDSGLDSGVELGRSWSDSGAPPEREAGVGGENEERRVGVEGEREQVEMGNPQTDYQRSPLVGPSGPPTLHSFKRRPSNTGRL
ncbi:opsin 6, group member b [Alosa alosa]|uniref:opsin 6, group member b n=1 Tax=Alosa alosa TaxID=278164 RepID=UPI0020152AF6|nr:opsin 6, group member b [Alosa alosa]